jgi:hypothetical protein
MNTILSGNLWKKLESIAQSSNTKRAAVAYVTSERIKFGQNDILIADASISAIQSGQTRAQILLDAFERGAAIYSCPGLHAKIIIFDRDVIIGSANISENSGSLIEAGIVTRNSRDYAMSLKVFDEIKKQSQRLKKQELEALCEVKVIRKPWNADRPKTVLKAPTSDSKTWVIRTHYLEEDPTNKVVERGKHLATQKLRNKRNDVAWIRWPINSGKFGKEAKKEDLVITIHRSKRGSKRAKVFAHARILRRQVDSKFIYFFVEEDDRSIPFFKFQKQAKAIGLGRLGGVISNDISHRLGEIWSTKA